VQTATDNPIGLGGQDTRNSVALTKLFIAKKIGNSTVKVGRQELPKSLSPFAFSEGWNVFKNTFDAILAVNTDIPDTTVVGAYVAGGTSMNLNTTGNLTSVVRTPNFFTPAGVFVLPAGSGTTDVEGTAYMLTVQNKSIPMTTVTASYYDVAQIGADVTAGIAPFHPTSTTSAQVVWLDAAIAGKDMPLGLKVGLQGGTIMPEDLNVPGVATIQFADTTAYGAKIGLKPIDALSVCLAYTSVDGDDNKANVAVKNLGTGIKTPLYTQMVANQNAIALDGNTIMLKLAFNTGDYGTITAQGSQTDAGKSNLNSFNQIIEIIQI